MSEDRLVPRFLAVLRAEELGPDCHTQDGYTCVDKYCRTIIVLRHPLPVALWEVPRAHGEQRKACPKPKEVANHNSLPVQLLRHQCGQQWNERGSNESTRQQHHEMEQGLIAAACDVQSDPQ